MTTHATSRVRSLLGLPSGGVPVAAEGPRRLVRRCDVIVVRKLGVPQQPELRR